MLAGMHHASRRLHVHVYHISDDSQGQSLYSLYMPVRLLVESDCLNAFSPLEALYG